MSEIKPIRNFAGRVQRGMVGVQAGRIVIEVEDIEEEHTQRIVLERESVLPIFHALRQQCQEWRLGQGGRADRQEEATT